MNKATKISKESSESKDPGAPQVEKNAPGVKPWSLRLLLIYAGIGFFVFWSWSQVGPQIFSAIAYNFAVLSVLTIASTFTRTIVLRRLLAMFLWGACMTGIAVVLSRLVTNTLNGYGAHNIELAMAPIEELLKLLPLFALLFVGRKFSIYTLGLTDFLLAGAAIGAGFSCVEYAAVHAH
ncbi:MAG: PrsW family intramembrane metalloprotease, partial [Leptolyngbya sp.]|nr:PrsW family intramembrane metalloprotease [Candidatus Melainabacteria bacterium]